MVCLKTIILLSALLLIALVSGCVQKTLTVTDIIEKKDEMINQQISIEGIAGIDKLRCTLMACPVENPCCNSCGGSLALSDDRNSIGIRGQYEGKGVSCSGSECSQSCYPLERGKKYTITGTLRKEGGLYIELKSFREGQ